MEAYVFRGTVEEIDQILTKLHDRWNTESVCVQVQTVKEPATPEEPATPATPDSEPATPVTPAKTAKKKEPVNYYRDGSIYKEILDSWNEICKKLIPRKPVVNAQLRDQLDKLVKGQSPYTIEEIRDAFRAMQEGEWFDDPENHRYGNFLWATQRSKIANALRGAYARNFNKNINTYNNGTENKRDNRQQLGGDGISTRGFDF